LVKGWVHDENAAVKGGVFRYGRFVRNADDLAKLMLFYQKKILYRETERGKTAFSAGTVKEFAEVQSRTKKPSRGWGFDKTTS